MDRAELVLGIDIGGTNTTFGYIDRSGRCLGESAIPTCGHEAPERFFPRLHTEARRLFEPLGAAHRLAGIGVGAPNGNHHRGTVEHPPNIRWGLVDLRGELASRWNVPVAVTNDANAAALGELLFGGARGMRDFIAITLGTGLGSGVVVNGEVVYGKSGFAGEIGHTIAERDGRPCGCGLRGCLETYASATGLVKTALELLTVRPDPSLLATFPAAQLTARDVFEAARQGDAVARQAFEVTGAILGRKLAESVAHTSPEAIFLLGGLASAGELIFEPARKAMEANLFHVFRGTVKLLPSAIPPGQAAILGAGALAWDALAKRRG